MGFYGFLDLWDILDKPAIVRIARIIQVQGNLERISADKPAMDTHEKMKTEPLTHQKMKTAPAYFTPTQIADLLGVTKRTIHTLTAKGLLPVVRLTGKTVRYPRAAVEASLEKLTVGVAR